jgi:hypothetical protein
MIRKGQIGKPIDLVGTLDLSGFASVYIRYTKPNGETGQWDAVVVDVYTVRYITTSATDVDVSGEWSVQGYGVRSNGNDDFTDIVALPVGKIIEVS